MCAALMSKWRMCSLRLRGLEIQGFKSFPDKTRLTFHDGITAVVGPNGSGKSNIADAVRWVLGEQSTKTLRGGKMEDVIFGGTQARKPQGYAHVQLTIENADGALPYDSAEVSVSRRLYRSGESEYRINGTSVRLRDVHELFMDTGLGRDGYSIIGQGRIAEIVSAKSTQRREIFEEAAGISKYRYRRQEAQRRLEAAEENLLRLRDILAELEARVGPLQAQAEKARRFLTLAEEKRRWSCRFGSRRSTARGRFCGNRRTSSCCAGTIMTAFRRKWTRWNSGSTPCMQICRRSPLRSTNGVRRRGRLRRKMRTAVRTSR